MAGREIRQGRNGADPRSGESEKRGVVACYSCGTENPETFIFCSVCGARISRLCPYCKEVHNVFVTICPRTGEPIPQESAAATKGKKMKKALAVSVGALAIAGSMILLNPKVQKETTHTYQVNPSPKTCVIYDHRSSPKPSPSLKIAPAITISPGIVDPASCCEYGVFPPERYGEKLEIIEKSDKTNIGPAPRYAVIIPE